MLPTSPLFVYRWCADDGLLEWGRGTVLVVFRGVMHPEPPRRYINSVSDLYETDEIEFLLDDIRELEPVSCKPEDIQVTVVCSHY